MAWGMLTGGEDFIYLFILQKLKKKLHRNQETLKGTLTFSWGNTHEIWDTDSYLVPYLEKWIGKNTHTKRCGLFLCQPGF